jgi:hypothetical protein
LRSSFSLEGTISGAVLTSRILHPLLNESPRHHLLNGDVE